MAAKVGNFRNWMVFIFVMLGCYNVKRRLYHKWQTFLYLFGYKGNRI
jgi:hypothetical protein